MVEAKQLPQTLESILIVDDHAICRDALDWTLRRLLPGKFEIRMATDGPSASSALLDAHPDLLILDIGLPGYSGLEVLQRLNHENPRRPKIIVFSQHDDPKLIAELTQLGVDAIILKSSLMSVFSQALEMVLAGESFMDPALASGATATANRAETPFDQLTKREKDVVRKIASGLTTKEIAKALECSDETVKTHKSNIMRKMRVRNSSELIAKLLSQPGSRGFDLL